MTGSGVTVGSTYIDIPVTIGTQLSTKQGHSTASVAHAKATGGNSLGVSVTPTSLPSGCEATPSAPPLSRLVTASNDALEKKNDQGHSARGRDHAHRSPQKSNPREGNDMAQNAVHTHTHQGSPVATISAEDQVLQFVDNLQQPPSYDELFPKGGPTNHS